MQISALAGIAESDSIDKAAANDKATRLVFISEAPSHSHSDPTRAYTELDRDVERSRYLGISTSECHVVVALGSQRKKVAIVHSGKRCKRSDPLPFVVAAYMPQQKILEYELPLASPQRTAASTAR
jgi:hypothetical protein